MSTLEMVRRSKTKRKQDEQLVFQLGLNLIWMLLSRNNADYLLSALTLPYIHLNQNLELKHISFFPENYLTYLYNRIKTN